MQSRFCSLCNASVKKKLKALVHTNFCFVMGPTETAYLLIAILAFAVVLWVVFASKAAEWQRQAEAEHTSATAANESSAAAIIYRAPFEVHHTTHPTPNDVIEALPSMRYAACQTHAAAGTAAAAAAKDEDRSTGHQKDKLYCSICCCEFIAQDLVKLLPCLHMYHEDCIDTWLKHDCICPVCKADVIAASNLCKATNWSRHTLQSVVVVSGGSCGNLSECNSNSSGALHAASADNPSRHQQGTAALMISQPAPPPEAAASMECGQGLNPTGSSTILNPSGGLQTATTPFSPIACTSAVYGSEICLPGTAAGVPSAAHTAAASWLSTLGPRHLAGAPSISAGLASSNLSIAASSAQAICIGCRKPATGAAGDARFACSGRQGSSAAACPVGSSTATGAATGLLNLSGPTDPSLPIGAVSAVDCERSDVDADFDAGAEQSSSTATYTVYPFQGPRSSVSVAAASRYSSTCTAGSAAANDTSCTAGSSMVQAASQEQQHVSHPCSGSEEYSRMRQIDTPCAMCSADRDTMITGGNASAADCSCVVGTVQCAGVPQASRSERQLLSSCRCAAEHIVVMVQPEVQR